MALFKRVIRLHGLTPQLNGGSRRIPLKPMHCSLHSLSCLALGGFIIFIYKTSCGLLYFPYEARCGFINIFQQLQYFKLSAFIMNSMGVEISNLRTRPKQCSQDLSITYEPAAGSYRVYERAARGLSE